ADRDHRARDVIGGVGGRGDRGGDRAEDVAGVVGQRGEVVDLAPGGARAHPDDPVVLVAVPPITGGDHRASGSGGDRPAAANRGHVVVLGPGGAVDRGAGEPVVVGPGDVLVAHHVELAA